MTSNISLELKERHFLAVLLFLAFLLAFNQPWVTSLDGDSIVYATISKVMAEEGHWLTPLYEGRKFFDHPPLVFWVNALLFKILGSGEWVAKLFSGLCGAGALALVFRMGSRAGGPALGFLAGLSMLLSYDFIKYLNKCRLDMPLVFLYTGALYFFLQGVEGNRKRGFYFMGVFAGLAFLAKGIVACGIFLTGLLFLAERKQLSFLKKKEPWLALLIFLVLPGVWIWAQYRVNGNAFLESYFMKQVQGSILGRTRPYGPFYYLGHLLTVYWPWLPFFLHGIFIAFKEEEKKPLWRLCLIWCLVVFLAFSAARFKIHYYLLPMFPAMALLAGLSLDRLIPAEGKLLGFKLTALASVLAALFLSVSPLPLHHNRYPEIYRMAPYLKEILREDDLILVYRDQAGITTPSLYWVNPRLRIDYFYDPKKLRETVEANASRRVFLYTGEENARENPDILEGFHPLMENNGKRFYSRDPNVRLSGRIYEKKI